MRLAYSVLPSCKAQQRTSPVAPPGPGSSIAVLRAGCAAALAVQHVVGCVALFNKVPTPPQALSGQTQKTRRGRRRCPASGLIDAHPRSVVICNQRRLIKRYLSGIDER
jgi:hypothetical protein